MKRVLLTLAAAFVAAVSTQAQIANPGFEAWDTASSAYYPSNWPLLNPGILDRVTDAHSGSYALKVSVWYYYTETKAVQVVPINYRPWGFAGWYKYTNNIIKNNTTGLTTPDTANAQVYLTKWNTTTMHTDTIGRGKLDLMGSASYSNFVCPVTYSSGDVPDTVIISMDPSLMVDAGSYFSTDSTGRNSYLTIDDLYLLRFPVLVSEVEQQVCIWPNPVGSHFQVSVKQAGAHHVIIADVFGRRVVDGVYYGKSFTIAEDMAPGTYIMKVLEEDGNLYTKTIVKQ